MSASPDSVRSFFPSLCLNLGKSYEDIGDLRRARELYEQGRDCAADAPDGAYGDVARQGLRNALERVREEGGSSR